MQMFFLKNLVGVSTATLLFAGISLSTIAEQELKAQEQPKQPTENLTTPMLPFPQLEHGHKLPINPETKAATDSDDLHIELYEKELEIEADPQASSPNIAESPDVRVEQRLETLNDAEESLDTPNPLVEPTEPSLPTPEDMVPLKPQANATIPNHTTVFEETNLVTEGEILVSGAMEEQDQSPALAQQLAEGMPARSTQSPMAAKLITPQTVAWDDRENQPAPKPKKDDSSDPTSEGDRKGGKKKGPKITDPRMIPIIRMGENLTQDSGFTIIKSWD
jgi:hypothetical protein